MKKGSFKAAMAVHIVHYIQTALSLEVRRKRAGKGGRRVRLLKDFKEVKDISCNACDEFSIIYYFARHLIYRALLYQIVDSGIRSKEFFMNKYTGPSCEERNNMKENTLILFSRSQGLHLP